MVYTYLESPIGPLLVAGDGVSLRRTYFAANGRRRAPESGWREDATAMRFATRQLEQYFAGERTTFDLPVETHGTPFQEAVWAYLRSIPFGETRTYGGIAAALGRSAASRAVGAANAANAVPIVIPCHRVIGSGGSLTGFGGGLDTKRWLLEFESGADRGAQAALF